MEDTNISEQARQRHRAFTAKFDRILRETGKTNEELAAALKVTVPILENIRTKEGHKTNALPLIMLLTQQGNINAEYLIREDETPTIENKKEGDRTLLERAMHWQRQVNYLKQNLKDQKQGAVAGQLHSVIQLMNEMQRDTSNITQGLGTMYDQLQELYKIIGAAPDPHQKG